jgi:hypothetical protein
MACACQLKQLELQLPADGAPVRVTLGKDLHLWQGSRQVVIPAGTVYEGVAANIDPEGFFDVVAADGQRTRIYRYDSAIQVDVLA